MNLPNIQGQTNQSGKFFFFAADTGYFNLYGKALAYSLRQHAPWAKVHVHIYNPSEEQLSWCEQHSVSYTYESVDVNYAEIKTYYACVRFIRIPEIFSNDAKIISFDCDVLARKHVPENIFDKDTVASRVTIRHKTGKSLASAIFFGPDDFRYRYSDRLKENFSKDNIYWFLDQVVLDEMLEAGEASPIGYEIWTSTKMNDKDIFWTAKGDRKESKSQYVELLNFYNSKV